MDVKENCVCRAIPTVVFIAWHLTVMSIGAVVGIMDSAIKNDACGQTYHIWKLVLMNVVFTSFSLMSFCWLPKGGEAARARSISCAVFHTAFGVWLMLLSMHMTAECAEVISSKFAMVNLFMYVCLGHNICMSLFYILHEAWLGQLYQTDFTLIAEIRVYSTKNSYNPLGSPKSATPNLSQSAVDNRPPLMSPTPHSTILSPAGAPTQMQSVQSVDQQINAQAAPSGPYQGSMYTQQP